MFNQLGRRIYRARWLVIAIWAVILAISLPFVPRVSHALKGGGFANGTSEADRTTDLLVRDLGFYPSNLTIILTSDTWQATDPRFLQAMHAALAPAYRLPHVARVETYYDHTPTLQSEQMISDDKRSTIAILDYDISFDRVQTLVPQVRASIHSPALKLLVAGDGAVFGDIQTVSNRDLQKVETYTFPVALVLLVLIFGTLMASAVPIITGAVSVAATLALMYALAQVADLSIFALNVTSMIGLGVGIDYALLVVSRFREEMHQQSVEEAVAIAMASAGRAVLFSGITVMIGLSGLLIFHSMALRSIGLGGSLVVLFSVAAALTLLPALLSVLGTRIDSLALVPWRAGPSPFWHGLAARVMRHPWPVIVGTLVIVGILASPFQTLQLNVPDATILPKSVPSRQGFDILNQGFHQQRDNPVVVVVQAPGGVLTTNHMAALYDYVQRIATDPAVRADKIQSLVTVARDATRDVYIHLQEYLANPQVARAVRIFTGREDTTVMTFPPQPGQSEAQLEALVRRVRAQPIGGGLHRYVGGYNAGVMDYLANLYGQFPFAIAIVLIVTYLALLALLRSVILPLKAVLMNALSLFGAYGVVVWIFQQGHLSRLLNFSATGYIDEITPIIMFCTLFGLSMDYEVFLLSRVREQYLQTGDNPASVALGLERTGRIITSAAAVLVVVAGSFSFTDIVLIKAVGLGLAVAILLDATLIRCLLVPATMRVLGEWNWWLPGWLRPLLGENRPAGRPGASQRFVA